MPFIGRSLPVYSASSVYTGPTAPQRAPRFGNGGDVVTLTRPPDERPSGNLATDLVGASPAMAEIRARLKRFAPTELPVLILGESGTGKELAAQAIHEGSPRAAKPFIAVNCATLSRELADSELFGYAKAAFTGATQDRKGLFEAADGGTLFLDEVGDLPPDVQTKLLRALEVKKIRPVGAMREKDVNVRIIAATNRDLGDPQVFRNDLFQRLNVLTVKIPALRERPEDIPLLARHLLDQINSRHGLQATLTPDALARLRRHAWGPGNVRELLNALTEAAVLSESGEITPALLEGCLEPTVANRLDTARPFETPQEAFDATLRFLKATGQGHAPALLREMFWQTYLAAFTLTGQNNRKGLEDAHQGAALTAYQKQHDAKALSGLALQAALNPQPETEEALLAGLGLSRHRAYFPVVLPLLKTLVQDFQNRTQGSLVDPARFARWMQDLG